MVWQKVLSWIKKWRVGVECNKRLAQGGTVCLKTLKEFDSLARKMSLLRVIQTTLKQCPSLYDTFACFLRSREKNESIRIMLSNVGRVRRR